MKPSSIAVVFTGVALCFQSCLAGGTNDPPEAGKMLDYAFVTLCGDLIGKIHESRGETPAKQALARRYYSFLFLIWFGTRYVPIKEAIHLDPRGYVNAFQREAKRENFADLIDYDDPIGWHRLPANYDKQEFIDFLGGVEYFTWVLQRTKDPEAYNKAVRQFRIFTESVKHDPAFQY